MLNNLMTIGAFVDSALSGRLQLRIIGTISRLFNALINERHKYSDTHRQVRTSGSGSGSGSHRRLRGAFSGGNGSTYDERADSAHLDELLELMCNAGIIRSSVRFVGVRSIQLDLFLLLYLLFFF